MTIGKWMLRTALENDPPCCVSTKSRECVCLEVAQFYPFSPEIGGDCLLRVRTDMADAGRQAGEGAFERGHVQDRPPHPTLSPKSFAVTRHYHPNL
jgi:hypothetical protein